MTKQTFSDKDTRQSRKQPRTALPEVSGYARETSEREPVTLSLPRQLICAHLPDHSAPFLFRPASLQRLMLVPEKASRFIDEILSWMNKHQIHMISRSGDTHNTGLGRPMSTNWATQLKSPVSLNTFTFLNMLHLKSICPPALNLTELSFHASK